MSDELKPCPFCSQPFEIVDPIGYLAGKVYTCYTPDCPGEDLIAGSDALNRRPIEDALRARVAELEAALKEIRNPLDLDHDWITKIIDRALDNHP